VSKIYVSSTYSDLKNYREEVYHTLRQLRHDVIAMEDYVATDQRPLDKCLNDVATCDIYVGIFAWRYGYIPDQDNPEQRSITELEYRKAGEVGIPRLIFILKDDASWPTTLTDYKTGEGDRGKCIETFRNELMKEKTVSFFENPDDLARLVSVAVQDQIGIDKSSNNALYDLQTKIQRLAAGQMRVPAEEVEQVKEIISQANAGIVKLMGNEETLESAGVRGGGAYYDFVRRDQKYGYGSDICLRDGELRTGFAGADYGYILRLGVVPFREVLAASVDPIPATLPVDMCEAWRFMWEYKPPHDIKEIRKHQEKARNKVVGNVCISDTSVAEEGASYLLRSVQIHNHDVLVAFHIQRVLPDRSAILVWKILKIFDTPVATGSED
jgi:hypothetical protein